MNQSARDLVTVEYGRFRRPEEVIDEAAHVARVFQQSMATILDGAKDPILYRMFGKSRHITRPGWQLLGSMYRVTAGIVEGSLKYVAYGEDINGFECHAEAIYVPTGARISTAVGMCLNDEDNWNLRPDYEWKKPPTGGKEVRTHVGDSPVPLFQLGSMAQTRACSKVLSNLLSYVAIMAGCSGTSAEEMTGGEPMNGAGESGRTQPQRTTNGGNGDGTISEPQVNRLFGLTKQANKSRDALGVVLAHFGYTDPNNDLEKAARMVKRTDFDKIQEAILKP